MAIPEGAVVLRGGRPPSDADLRTIQVNVRWESALPVQEALRLNVSNEKSDPDFKNTT